MIKHIIQTYNLLKKVRKDKEIKSMYTENIDIYFLIA